MFYSQNRNFQSLLSNFVKGTLGSTLKSSLSVDQGALTTVISKVSYLRRAIDLATSWTNIFSCLVDKIPTEANYKVTVDSNNIVTIDDVKSEVIEGVDFIKNNYGEKLTWVDADGLTYNLHLLEESWVEDGHNITSVVKTSVRQCVDDCLFYFEDGVLKLNQHIRSANFSSPAIVTEGRENIIGCTGLYCDKNGYNFDGTLFSSLPGSGSTVIDKLRDIVGSTTTVIKADLLNALGPVPQSPPYQGKVKLIWDVLRDYTQSADLNASILEAIQAISGGAENFRYFISTSSLRINNAISAVKSFWIGLSNAFGQGGFKGSVYYILEYFKDASSMTDSEGLLSFTNNSSLTPRQYIAGMIEGIFTSVSALASAIATAVQPAIGMLFATAGSFVYGVYKSIAYDANATKVAIQTSDKVLVPAFPWASLQDEYACPELLGQLLSEYPVLLFEVPGGYIVTGVGSTDTDGHITTCRSEFHASSIPVFEATFFYDYYTATGAADPNYNDRYVVNATVNFSPTLRIQLERHWRYYSVHESVENQSNGRLSDMDDLIMKRTLILNNFAFLYWIGQPYYAEISGSYWGHISSSATTYWLFDSFHTVSNSVGTNYAKLLIECVPFLTHTSVLHREYDNFGIGSGTWNSISECFESWGRVDRTVEQPYYYLYPFSDEGFRTFGDPIIAPSSFEWAIVPAKYDSATFLNWIIISSVALAAITVAAVITTVKIKKLIQNKRASLNRDVENAWSSYSKGQISYSDYRKTVKRANRWQTIIGGTRYDYENYWNGDVSEAAGNVASHDPDSQSSISSVCTDLANRIYSPEVSSTEDVGAISNEDISSSVDDIICLIKG